VSHRLAETHRRQAVHTKTRTAQLMFRLAVGDEPPGGFWKNPETPMQQCVKQYSDRVIIQSTMQ